MVDIIGETEIIATKVKANNRYGQNQATNPSSDLPGQHTHIDGFGKQVTVPDSVTAKAGETGNWQTRSVSAEQLIPTTFGMKGASAGPKISNALDYPGAVPVRPVTK
jgi:hypothetical protein